MIKDPGCSCLFTHLQARCPLAKMTADLGITIRHCNLQIKQRASPRVYLVRMKKFFLEVPLQTFPRNLIDPNWVLNPIIAKVCRTIIIRLDGSGYTLGPRIRSSFLRCGFPNKIRFLLYKKKEGVNKKGRRYVIVVSSYHLSPRTCILPESQIS